MRKIIVVLMLVSVTTALGAETKIIPMPDLLKPEALFFDKTQMYVTEGTSIHIFALKDFKLIKKFGKQGEGPQEFIVNAQFRLLLNVQTDDILVQSFGKLSWYTKDGKYKRELKLSNPLILNIQPFGKNFVGIQIALGQKRMRRLNLYDDKINEIKNIIEKEDMFQLGKGILIMKALPFSPVYNNKLFLAWEDELEIKVLDTKLNELYTVKYDIKKEEITEKDKKDIIHFFKTDPSTRDYFEILKPFKFTPHFPAIQNLIVTCDKIYVSTFKSKDEEEEREFLIFDIKGTLLKKVFLPFKMDTPIRPYPVTIHDGFLYQLVEDMEEEEWLLHVAEIK